MLWPRVKPTCKYANILMLTAPLSTNSDRQHRAIVTASDKFTSNRGFDNLCDLVNAVTGETNEFKENAATYPAKVR